MHLPSIQTPEGSYSLLNLSQAVELADALQIPLDAPLALQTLETIFADIMQRLSGEHSGVVVGPEIGFNSLDTKNSRTGVLFSLCNQTKLQLVSEMPVIASGWSVQHIRNNYGLVYLKLYYNPHAANAVEKWKFVSEIHDAARYEGCQVVLELALYPESESSTKQEVFTELQLFAARQMQTVCDLLILEYPHSALAAATLTAQLDIPWLVVDRTEDYGYFKELLRACMESGASGVSIGPVLWANMPPLIFESGQPEAKSWEAVRTYIHTELRDRCIEVMRIVREMRTQQDDPGVLIKKMV